MDSKPELADILEHYGINVKHRSGWTPCKCIIHDDTHASAAYNLDTQTYNCLVCNLLGDVYTLVKAKEQLGRFPDVVSFTERITHGNSRTVSRSTNIPGSLLPSIARGNKRGSKRKPSWASL